MTLVMAYFLTLTLQFAEMGGGGIVNARMEFTTKGLCDAFHKIMWNRFQDMKGKYDEIGDCTPIPKIDIPKIEDR